MVSDKCTGRKCGEKICNPQTGRCVSRTGYVGRRLLAMTDRCAARTTECVAEKICNPQTGRCVARTGKTGLALKNSNQKPIRPLPKIVVKNCGTGKCVLPPKKKVTKKVRFLTPQLTTQLTPQLTISDTPVVNASHRFMVKNGVKITQSVPKNPKYTRKAPAGHAANYAGQTARGLDGKMWESQKLKKIVRKNGNPSYRWMPLEK